MITHIVLFKLNDRSTENIQKAHDVLSGMQGKIPYLRHLEVGVDVLRSERSYDLALVAKFDSLEDLQAYQIHPVHMEVSRYMTMVRESSVAVDFDS
ncbi:Dabb family protein [Desulfoscipio geothermicus]|uniref:Stress responsive A/B Barrel Domain n=1 Tax=Desulfoscipio geothermicus DSM 3669 TaxID=1121426 RepID=A0A1I6CYL4_9FIRM|nr:Dabb family protein [Desulfoscipio geothermicus]SFQ98355.1 Stress responsive A/B Barrel Domain [Desulfoscipio geothermicus DSM 3669]